MRGCFRIEKTMNRRTFFAKLTAFIAAAAVPVVASYVRVQDGHHVERAAGTLTYSDDTTVDVPKGTPIKAIHIRTDSILMSKLR